MHVWTRQSPSIYLLNGTHITQNSIVSKARQRTSVLLRGFVFRRLDIIRTAFVTYVRSLLEYSKADQWQLAININKCSVLHIAPKTRQSPSIYLLNGTQIPVHSSCVDLGVILNDDLSFRDHINSIVSEVSKARQRTSVLLRGFVFRRLDIMRTAFVTYVRPLLEYNSVVWNPSQKQFIDLIENVQRSFSKRIPSLSLFSYHERLAFLDLEP
jgi:hypothetical protein